MARFFAVLLSFASLQMSVMSYGHTLNLENQCLKNIEQLTSPDMGFVKAGEAYFSPDGNTIIFQAVPHGSENYQIYTLNLNTTQKIPKLVSTGQGSCTCAYFRPDGKKIIFASSHEDPGLHTSGHQPTAPGYKRDGKGYAWDFTPYMNIYEANVDGSDLKPLTQGPAYHAECAYSPDGSKIVFASNFEGNMNLYIMNADGSNLYSLTQTSKGYNGGPFFSPDGTQVIFRADYETPHYLQIYLINTDGTHLRQLTNNSAVNWAPYWHPNGKVIAFTTSLQGHMNYEVYLLNIETAACYRVTYREGFDGIPVFNLEGTKIMWTSKRGVDNSCQIFIADFEMPKEIL